MRCLLDGEAYEVTRTVAKRIEKLLRHGRAILHSGDFKLVIVWEQQVIKFLRAAYGDEEVERFLSDYGSGGMLRGPEGLVDWRLAKLEDLVRRFEFAPIRSDFDPDQWQDS